MLLPPYKAWGDELMVYISFAKGLNFGVLHGRVHTIR